MNKAICKLEIKPNKVPVTDSAVPGVPPSLRGYNYSAQRARQARDAGRLLAIRLETSSVCNLSCIYCNGASGKARTGEMSLDTMKRVIVEAQSLGAESIVVIGGGEPTMYPKFTKLVEFIARQELIPVIITNGLKCSREMTQFLYDHNASVLCKLDSLDENIQDVLSGKPETFKRIRQGIDNLSDTGFACCKDNEMRCGLSFVVTRLNYTGIPQLWRFCRDMNLYPNLEALVPRGRAHEEIDKLEISALELSNLKQELRTIDVEHYGCDWVPHTPLPGHGCLQLMYSLYITSMGNIRPCADIDIDGLGLNVKNISLANVLENEFIRMARGIEFRLEGRCSDCEHSMVCIGCRGIAFTVGMIEGKSPLQALSREDPTCLK